MKLVGADNAYFIHSRTLTQRVLSPTLSFILVGHYRRTRAAEIAVSFAKELRENLVPVSWIAARHWLKLKVISEKGLSFAKRYAVSTKKATVLLLKV